MMRSVPGAVRGPQAGSPLGVVDATGSQLIVKRRDCQDCYPVATAPGTDSMTVVPQLKQHPRN